MAEPAVAQIGVRQGKWEEEQELLYHSGGWCCGLAVQHHIFCGSMGLRQRALCYALAAIALAAIAARAMVG